MKHPKLTEEPLKEDKPPEDKPPRNLANILKAHLQLDPEESLVLLEDLAFTKMEVETLAEASQMLMCALIRQAGGKLVLYDKFVREVERNDAVSIWDDKVSKARVFYLKGSVPEDLSAPVISEE